MGQQAMQMALALMTETPSDLQTSDISIKGQLIVRESSGPPRDPTNK
jgi:DNA-binding LacI/PurR family transcriptional regulator